jgi:hypothetical protein
VANTDRDTTGAIKLWMRWSVKGRIELDPPHGGNPVEQGVARGSAETRLRARSLYANAGIIGCTKSTECAEEQLRIRSGEFGSLGEA